MPEKSEPWLELTATPKYKRFITRLRKDLEKERGGHPLPAGDQAVVDYVVALMALRFGILAPPRVPKRGGKRANAGRPKSDAAEVS